MNFRSAGIRCVFDFSALALPISNEEALSILRKHGFQQINVDLVGLARSCIGKSRYRLGATVADAPEIVDCSSFVKWLYAQRGVWLPRRSVQQRALGESVGLSELAPGDLVFTTGYWNYYVDDPNEGVGHVGIASGAGTIIHATNGVTGVVEQEIDIFLGGRESFRGVRRFLPHMREVITLSSPRLLEVETMDDLKWIILQSLPE